MPKKRKRSPSSVPPAKRASSPKKKMEQWTREELQQVLELYDRASNAIHEGNPLIEELGRHLGRSTRSVEAQLNMFRALDRGERSGWAKMSRLTRELWGRRGSFNEAQDAVKHAPANCTLDTLLARAFGGVDVAAKPGDVQSFWPIGPGPLGVDSVIEMLARECQRERSGDHHWVFLLGAAGNGKSSAANALIERATEDRTKRDLINNKSIAMRTYRYALRSRGELIVINDATIARQSEYSVDVPIALAVDIESWASKVRKRTTHALVCANRGVLIEELHALDTHRRGDHKFSGAVLSWLDSGDFRLLQAAGVLGDDLDDNLLEHPAGYYRRARLRISGQVVVLHALAVDVGSLCEPRSAAADVDVGNPLGLPPVEVCDGLRGPKDGRSRTVAATLATELIKTRVAALVSERSRLCPLVANVRALTDESLLNSWLTTIRAAEIASGTQFTYRDFWGLVALSLVGPRTNFGDSTGTSISVAAHVDSLLDLAAREANPVVRLSAISKLAARRTHMALFQGAPIPFDFDRVDLPPAFPALPGFVRVDPAQDVCRHTADVTESVDVVSIGLRPSQILSERIPNFEWDPLESTCRHASLSIL